MASSNHEEDAQSVGFTMNSPKVVQQYVANISLVTIGTDNTDVNIKEQF